MIHFNFCIFFQILSKLLHCVGSGWQLGSRFFFFFHGALRPHKPYGLLGTGEEWDREREPGSTSLFTQLLSSKMYPELSSFMVLYMHRNRRAY